MSNQQNLGCIRTTNPLKINRLLLENYLNANIADCIQTDAEVFDITQDIKHTHVIYIATWAKLIKGESKHARLEIDNIDLGLDCISCKTLCQNIHFKLGDIPECNGEETHQYPGNILSKHEYIVSSNDEKIILSMWQLGIKWKPVEDDDNDLEYEPSDEEDNKDYDEDDEDIILKDIAKKSPSPMELFCSADVKFWCKRCINGGLLGKRTVWTTTKSLWLFLQEYWKKNSVAKCNHIQFDPNVMESFHSEQPFVSCWEIVGTHDHDIVKAMWELLPKHVPKEVVMIIVDFSTGLWLNLH